MNNYWKIRTPYGEVTLFNPSTELLMDWAIVMECEYLFKLGILKNVNSIQKSN
jgi:hypothetical protein